VIEGACRSLVKDRMDLTGARWGLAGGEAVLQVRSRRVSGDLNAYLSFYAQRERNHLNQFDEGELIELRPAALSTFPDRARPPNGTSVGTNSPEIRRLSEPCGSDGREPLSTRMETLRMAA